MKLSAHCIAAFAIALIMAGVGGGCRCATTTPSPAPQEADVSKSVEQDGLAPERRFAGILRGGIIAVGAETTGWQLERDDATAGGGGASRVDVDVSKFSGDLSQFDGKRVVIEGTMTKARWTERGERQLLIVDQIRAE